MRPDTISRSVDEIAEREFPEFKLPESFNTRQEQFARINKRWGTKGVMERLWPHARGSEDTGQLTYEEFKKNANVKLVISEIGLHDLSLDIACAAQACAGDPVNQEVIAQFMTFPLRLVEEANKDNPANDLTPEFFTRFLKGVGNLALTLAISNNGSLTKSMLTSLEEITKLRHRFYARTISQNEFMLTRIATMGSQINNIVNNPGRFATPTRRKR